MLQVFFNLF